MVKLHIKRGETSLFLFETVTSIPIVELIPELIRIHNARLRLERLADEVSQLAEHGIYKPTEAVGLTDEQIVEMKIKDLWTPKCFPSGGSEFNRDVIGKRTGNAPKAELKEVLNKTCAEALAATEGKTFAAANKCMTLAAIEEQIQIVKGAVMIVYPMGLPPYDEVTHILNNTENLAGRQAELMVLDEETGALWWAGKELMRGKVLADYVGKNEKTKIVAKLQSKGSGAPVREPAVSPELQKEMMAYAYKKQEEMKKLEEADDDAYLGAAWADSSALKNRLQGTTGIGWRPK